MLAADGEACSLEAADAIGVGDAAEICFFSTQLPNNGSACVFFLKR